MRNYQIQENIGENSEICKFKSHSLCKILLGVKCDGLNKNCHFFKTEFQFIKDEDHAILINRKNGNCDKCKYTNIKCPISNYSIETIIKG